MSFILKEIEELNLSELNEQILPFTKGEDMLPECTIRFLKRPKDILQGKTRLTKVGGHSFYILEEGIMVANATTFALLRKNFKEIDVYIPNESKKRPYDLMGRSIQ